MFDKLVTGVISLSMMLFSSYQGNEPKFARLNSVLSEDRILIFTKLENAFENDFEEVFKSGNEIFIYFTLSIKQKDQSIFRRTFFHSVEYDPLLKQYFIELQEQEKKITSRSFDDLIETITVFEFDYLGDFPDRVTVSLTAYLEKLYLDSLDKEYDLMLLWKLQKPQVSNTVRRANL